MKKTKEQKGITLIALIITIIILLILAVVTINSIKNGQIIEYARQAKDDYNAEKEKEETLLQNYLEVINTNDPNQSDTDNEKEETLDPALNHSGTVPVGGKYISYGDTSTIMCEEEYCQSRNVFSCDVSYYSNYGTKCSCECGTVSTDDLTPVEYKAGETFPSVIHKGDIYTYGDYMYRYNVPLAHGDYYQPYYVSRMDCSGNR